MEKHKLSLKQESTTNSVNTETNLAVIGLGYVGLPLAIEFGKKFNTVGFDINKERIQELKNSKDSTLSIEISEFDASNSLSFSSDKDSLPDCNIYIVAVPTPLDINNQPDLISLKNGEHRQQGNKICLLIVF